MENKKKILIKTKKLDEVDNAIILEFIEIIKELPEAEKESIEEFLNDFEEEEFSELGLIKETDVKFIPERFVAAVKGVLNPTGILIYNDYINETKNKEEITTFVYLEVIREISHVYKNQKKIKLSY